MAEQKQRSQAEWELWRGFFSLALTGTAQPQLGRPLTFKTLSGRRPLSLMRLLPS